MENSPPPPPKRQRLTTRRQVWMYSHWMDDVDEYKLYSLDLGLDSGSYNINTNGDVDGYGYTHILPTFRFNGHMRARGLCILGSSLYIFEGANGIPSIPRRDEHPGKLTLKFDLRRSSNKKMYEDCDLERPSDMPTLKNYPTAIPTPDGKNILVFSLVLIYDSVDPPAEHQNHFELYDPSTDSWEQLPQLSFPNHHLPPLSRQNSRIKGVQAFSFLNDHIFYVQFDSGMFTIDLKSSEKRWDFLGDPYYDLHVPWYWGYFPTINNKFVFLYDMIVDVVRVGLSREEREGVGMMVPSPSFPDIVEETDMEYCQGVVLPGVMLLHDNSDRGLVQWCGLKSKYIESGDSRFHSRLLLDVRRTDLAKLDTDTIMSLKFLIDLECSPHEVGFVPAN